MSIQVKRRREAAPFLATFTGAQAELIVDTTSNRVQVHDGSTPGGWPAAKLNETQTIGRSPVTDANYAMSGGDVLVAVTALTASRTLTLPLSSSYSTGRVLRIIDESGAAAASLQIVVATQGSDLLDGGHFLVIQSAYGSLELVSNSLGKWFSLQDAPSVIGNLAQLGVNTAPDPTNPLSATLNAALLNALYSTYGGSGDVRLKLNKQTPTNTASVQFQDNFSGHAEVGLCGDDNFHFKVSGDGSKWTDALIINASTGVVSAANAIQTPGVNGGAIGGNRNRIINGNFAVNQRVYVSGALVAGIYGFDRWKAGSAGATLAPTAGVPDTIVSISAGTLVQVIESVTVEGGTYVLSWSGSAQARLYQGSATGSFASSPMIVSGVAAGANTTVEFNTGTLGLVQLEPGSVATPFERRPFSAELMLCMRYFQTSYDAGVAAGAAAASPSLSITVCGTSSSATIACLVLPVPMRIHPTGIVFSPNSGSSGHCYRNNAAVDAPAYFQGLTTKCCSIGVLNTSVSNEGLQANYTLNAEL